METKNISRSLPVQGLDAKTLLEQLNQMQTQDVAWKEGKTWSLVYYAGKEHDRLIKDAYSLYFSSNYLNPFAFESLQKMEKEVVQMTATMLNGNESVVGTMSSGGTESILLAMYTYREWARKHRPEVLDPEIIAPQTIHPAHDKAAHLFGLRLRKTEVDDEQCAIPSEMERLINKNTILLVTSAPSYANGIMDPVAEIGQLAEKNQLPLHVDACIGGFILPWLERLGSEVPPWDFRVPGVTSISADVHKFGFGAKGSSVILYKNLDFLKHQFFITTDFPGGIYISPTILGTRPGAPIAAAWAAMRHLGEEGYTRMTHQLMEGTKRLLAVLQTIPEVRVIGKPIMNIISYTTHNNQPDIFAIADYLQEMGWMIDRQQSPDCIHMTILPTNVNIIDRYTEDLKQAIEYTKDHPEASGQGNAAIYGLMARIPFRGMVEKNVLQIFENMYGRQEQQVGADGGSDVIAPTTGWMRWVSRFLAFWKRVFSKV